MKNKTKTYLSWVIAMLLSLSLFGCKGSDSDTGGVMLTIDISALKQQLLTTSNESASTGPSMLESPDTSPAQNTVKTLMIAPITYSNHGEAYSMDSFDKDAEDDFENDAANSIDYLQFIQLPTSRDTVEVTVPAISDGWQLLAAATSNKVEEVGDLGDDGNDASLVYVGFTEQSFTSAEDFRDAGDVVLTLKRHCDQDDDDQPKGCATFDGHKEAIVTDAVEIHGVKINGTMQSSSNPFPWIVRSGPSGDEISAADAEARLNGIVGLFGNASSITNITVLSTHQLSAVNDGNSDCRNLTASDATADFIENCTSDEMVQEATRAY